MTEQRSHSRFGGSVASRWLRCPGSVALADTVPPRPTSSYAQEGKIAHALAEQCLKDGVRTAAGYTNSDAAYLLDGARGQISHEMVEAVDVYLSAVWAEFDADPSAELFVEQRFSLEIATADKDEVFGTNDALVYSPSRKRLAIFDYKHGAGVAVDATNNTQAKFYAVGAAFAHSDWPIEAVEIFIVQPRARNVSEAGAVKQWLMDPLELLDFSAELEAGIAAAKQPDAPRHAGPHCQFCPAAAICPEREQQGIRAAAMEFESVAVIDTSKVLPPPRDLGLMKISRILLGAEILEEWFGQVRQFALECLENGIGIPGYKLVEKDSRRKFNGDEDELVSEFGLLYDIAEDELRPRKLATITEIERKLAARVKDKDELRKAKEAFSLKYTIKESSGVRIAPASDKRPAVNAVATDYASVKLPAA